MFSRTARRLLFSLALALLAASTSITNAATGGSADVRVHYLEIVSNDVAAQCAVLEQTHGLSFGPENADLGGARVAERPDGTLVGVRAPLAEHDTPITRSYFAVDDIAAAVAAAEAAGAMIAYGPIQQGDTGTWAIYFLGDAQIGLWQP